MDNLFYVLCVLNIIFPYKETSHKFFLTVSAQILINFVHKILIEEMQIIQTCTSIKLKFTELRGFDVVFNFEAFR